MKRIAATSTLSLMLALDVQGANLITLQIDNEGPDSLNQFVIKGKLKDGKSMATLKSSSFLTTDFFVINATSEPTSLASGSVSLLTLNARVLDQLEVWAASAGSSQLVIAHAR